MQTMAIDLTSSWTISSVTVVATNKSAKVLESMEDVQICGMTQPRTWYTL